jgi:hypothetical protein
MTEPMESLAADGRWTGDPGGLRRQLAVVEAEARATPPALASIRQALVSDPILSSNRLVTDRIKEVLAAFGEVK